MRIFLPILALSAIAAPAVAAPASADEIVTVRINTADIDVTTSEGRAILEARINEKVRKACTIAPASRYGYGRPVRDEACMVNARAEAMAKVERIAAAKQRRGREVAAN